MAPGPNGPYWKEGMQNGYQDVGSWTFFKDHDANRTAAAWLYAQFVTAKTVSLKKTLVGLTPIRESDIQSEAMTKMAPKLGGLVEFYRSPSTCCLDAYWHQCAGLSEVGAAYGGKT